VSRTNPQKNKKKGVAETKKRKARTTYIQYDLREAEKFSLCDAMRYVIESGIRKVLLIALGIYEPSKSDRNRRLSNTKWLSSSNPSRTAL
jgi:hypothetical protein